MKIREKRIRKYFHCFMVAAVVLFSLTACDYMRRAYLRGQVVDVGGQALPGVVVRVVGTEFETQTNALGQYRLGVGTGRLQVEFLKTGYSPARMDVNVETMGIMEMPQAALWPLPIGEGVYLFQNLRYTQTSHPRPNRYRVQELGTAFGTPVNPELVIPWTDPEAAPDENPPFMVGHKVPAYDVRMHKLQRANAALMHASNEGVATPRDDSEAQYQEEVWIAEKSIPVWSCPLDEAERLLVELRAAEPLEPGMYAIHWGALEGYDSIEPRIFLFSIEEPPQNPEEEEGEIENGEVQGEE